MDIIFSGRERYQMVKGKAWEDLKIYFIQWWKGLGSQNFQVPRQKNGGLYVRDACNKKKTDMYAASYGRKTLRSRNTVKYNLECLFYELEQFSK